MDQTPHQLRKNSLGLGESIIMGVAGTAPAYSIAATTETLFSSVGTLSTASIFYCGLIMFGITLAFFHLNRVRANAGTSYAWVKEIFHPTLGFFVGWSLLVAASVFMVSGTVPAATGLLALVYPSAVESPAVVMLFAACLLLSVGFVVLRGIKLASYLQTTFTLIEVGALAAVIIGTLWTYQHTPLRPFLVSDLSITAFNPTTFAVGALTALFFFWGWDVTLNLSEETKHSDANPGKGAVWAMFISILLFTSFNVATQFALTDVEVKEAGTNIILALADKIFGRPYSYVVVVAVVMSTLGTLETTIIQFTRTLFSKARDGALNKRYAALHEEWKTPILATVIVVSIGIFFLFLSSFSVSVNEVINVSVKAIGFQVAFYYGLTGLACAWYFRKESLESVGKFITWFLWPFCSGAFMLFIGVYSAFSFETMATVIGIGGILSGVIPYMLNRHKREST